MEAGTAPRDIAPVELAALLGELRDVRALDSLLNLLRHRDPPVRTAAARALGQLDDPRIVDWLLPRLLDTAESVRREVSRALVHAGIAGNAAVFGDIWSRVVNSPSSDSVKSIVGAFATISHSSVNTFLVDQLSKGLGIPQALQALAQKRDSSILNALVELLDDPNSDKRTAAAAGLSAITIPTRAEARVVNALMKYIFDDSVDLRVAVAKALGNIRGRISANALLKQLDDDSASVRVAAADSLGALAGSAPIARFIRSPETAPLITPLTNDDDPAVRTAIIRTIGIAGIGRDELKSTIIELLDDDQAAVRREALGAIARTLERTQDRLLFRDFDAEEPWLDPKSPIDIEWVKLASGRLRLSVGVISAEYEALKTALGGRLYISWQEE